MPRRLLLRPAAVEDVAEAHAWYSNDAERPASAFLADVHDTMTRIREHPLQFPDIGGARRALLHRFPYAVYFIAPDDARAVVLAVLHQHRNPGGWRRRIRDDDGGR